jgi:ABC-type transport system involved in multi-copper enzyme maturation permease subunit
MSRPFPGFWHTARAAAALTVLRLRRGRSVWFSIAIAGLLLAAAAVIRVSTDVAPAILWDAMVDYPLRRVLVFLVPFLFCATALSEEIEARTATYLFSRPASRAAILFGKWVAGAGLAVLIVCGSVIVLYGICWSGGDGAVPLRALERALVGFGLASTCYGAMFLCFGVMLVDAPYLLCVLWVGIVELAVSFLPGVVRLVSMSTHLGNIIENEPAAAPTMPFFAAWSPEVPVWASAAVLAVVGGAFLLAATSMASGSEVRYGKS